jgi:cell fate regulator YaaT (PSP1 superfamily)
MPDADYLVTYGRSGDFGRFRAAGDCSYRRGDRVVVSTAHGLDLGSVLCRTLAGHEMFLSRTLLGEVVRPVNDDDERTARASEARAQELFDEGRRLARELALPLEIVDVEVLLDGGQAVVHHVRADCDYRALVSRLSRHYGVVIVMNNLALPREPAGHDGAGCGRPDCGQGGGGCSSCGSSGGCGTCGKGTTPDQVASYLLGLREQMEQRARTPLL